MVSRRGTEAAVLVPIEQWNRLKAGARPSLMQLLLASDARTEELVPARGGASRRPVVELLGMAFLLDTTVVSELRRSRPHGGVVAWIESVDDAEL